MNRMKWFGLCVSDALIAKPSMTGMPAPLIAALIVFAPGPTDP